jgi:hypothetical protein
LSSCFCPSPCALVLSLQKMGQNVEPRFRRANVLIVVGQTPEAEAFIRWQNHDFLQIERLYARSWRNQLNDINLCNSGKYLEMLGFDKTPCKSLEQIKIVSEMFVDNLKDEQLKLLLSFLNIYPERIALIMQRWNTAGNKSLLQYAPYAAYLLTVELFFLRAISGGFISANRPSNQVDIAYHA